MQNKENHIYHLKVLDKIEKIEDIKVEWNSLLEESGIVSSYLKPEWVINWLRYLGKRCKPYIVTWDNGNKLQAIYPLKLKKNLLGNRLDFIGKGDADYLDFIVDKNIDDKWNIPFLSFLKGKKNNWDICDLQDFPEQSQHIETLYKLLKNYGWKVKYYNTWKCPYLTLDCEWGDIIKKHGRKFRYNIKRSKKQLEGLGRLEFKKIETEEELERYLPEIFNIHKKRWKNYYIASKFSTIDGRKFYSQVAKEYLEKGILSLELLLLNNHIIAFSFSFQIDQKYFYYIPAYDPDYAKYSPGKVLLMHILEEASKSGIEEFDFGKGELQYKYHWTTGERQNRRIIFASPTLKGKIIFFFYLLYLNIFSYLRKSKSLRIVLGRLKQINELMETKNIYVPPEAIVSPREVFQSNNSQQKLIYNQGSPALFFENGRTALLHGLKISGLPLDSIILIPDYICDSVINAIKTAGLNYRFYKIRRNLEPDLDEIDKKSEAVKALLIIHYFGFPQPLDRINDFCRDRELMLIEDCAHALFSNIKGKHLGRFGDFGFFSLKKTIPLPDGGMLLLNNWIDRESPQIQSGSRFLSRLSLLEKWAEFKTGLSLRCRLLQMDNLRSDFIRRDHRREIIPDKGISAVSLKMLQRINIDEIITKRRDNYRYYLGKLLNKRGVEIIYPELWEGVCPIGFPILLEDRDRIRKRLLERGINLRTLWDILPEEVSPEEHPIAVRFSDRIIILPVHQSLEERHLDYTITNLLSVR